METFKDTTKNVLLTPEHCTLRTATESTVMVKMGSVCITLMAERPPIKTTITISLSGSNCDDLDPGLASEEAVDKPEDVLVDDVVPASVKPAVNLVSKVSVGIPASVKPAVNLVSTVSGRAGEMRHAVMTPEDGNTDMIVTRKAVTEHLSPSRLLGHDQGDGGIDILRLDMTGHDLSRAQTEVRHRRPAPSKTELHYWFSISRILLPARAGRHGALGLISMGETGGGQVAVVTKQTAGRNWRKSDLFLQTVNSINQARGRLAPKAVQIMIVRNGKANTKTRPGEGARLSR